MEINRTSGTAGERAFLVSVFLDDQGSYQADPLEELADLASAGATVVGRLTQRRQTPDKTTYLGSGKVGELKLQAEAEDADVVVFDNNLSPAQIRNLEKVLGIKVSLDEGEVLVRVREANGSRRECIVTGGAVSVYEPLSDDDRRNGEGDPEFLPCGSRPAARNCRAVEAATDRGGVQLGWLIRNSC